METDEKGPRNPGEGEEEQGQRESPRAHLAEDPMRTLQRCVRDPLRVRLSIWWQRLPTCLLRLQAQRRVMESFFLPLYFRDYFEKGISAGSIKGITFLFVPESSWGGRNILWSFQNTKQCSPYPAKMLPDTEQVSNCFPGPGPGSPKGLQAVGPDSLWGAGGHLHSITEARLPERRPSLPALSHLVFQSPSGEDMDGVQTNDVSGEGPGPAVHRFAVSGWKKEAPCLAPSMCLRGAELMRSPGCWSCPRGPWTQPPSFLSLPQEPLASVGLGSSQGQLACWGTAQTRPHPSLLTSSPAG